MPSDSGRQPGRGTRETDGPALPRQDAAADDSRDEGEPRREDAEPMQPAPEAKPADAPLDAAEQTPPQRATEPRAPSEKRPGDTPKPPADEDLFNLDEGPRSTPWRSFTAAARRASREER